MSLPLHVVSGFLGSGKTTLLNRLLRDPRLENALVLVNEFGEVGIDHLLVGRLDEETVLLRAGCVCCSLRDDLLSTLEAFLDRRESGALARIDRVILETTGLADPAPIAATLGPHSPVAGSFHLDGLVVTVDALFGRTLLEESPEARSQIALADRLVVTKLDLAPEERGPLVAELEAMNPRATIVTDASELSPVELLSAGPVRPTDGCLDLGYWLAPVPEPRRLRLLESHSHEHSDVRSFVIVLPGEVIFERFAMWIALFTQMNGGRILRIKALLSAEGEDGFLAIDAIRTFVHPPTRTPPIPGAVRESTIVFIVRGFSDAEEGAIRTALASTTRDFIPRNDVHASDHRR